MKKLLLFAVAILTMAGTASAADNDGRVQIGAGLLYENGLELTVGYEKEMSHHNAWEFFGNVYLKWDKCADWRLLQNYLSKNKQKPELSQAEAFLFP